MSEAFNRIVGTPTTPSSFSSQIKRQIIDEFYKGHDVQKALKQIGNEVTAEQLTECFEKLRNEKPLFRFREKRCICWRCVNENAECCANPTLKRPRICQYNADKLSILPLYKWSQRCMKFYESGFEHPHFVSFDGRHLLDLDFPLKEGLRIIDSFSGKSSRFKQDADADYRAIPVTFSDELAHYSLSTVLFVEKNLAVVTLIDDDRFHANDMIGLLKIQYDTETFSFLDFRSIDLREDNEERFFEYVEVFKIPNNPDSKEWRFGIIMTDLDDSSFLTFYSVKQNNRGHWSKLSVARDEPLIPWEISRGFAYYKNDILYTIPYFNNVLYGSRYALMPTLVFCFNLNTQTWTHHRTNAAFIPLIAAHFRAVNNSYMYEHLQMENSVSLDSRLFCSVRLEPSKIWRLLVLNMEAFEWSLINAEFPSLFWTISVSHEKDTLLLCNGYKLCRSASTTSTEHFQFFRIKIGGRPEKLFNICYSAYSTEIAPHLKSKQLSATVARITDANFNSSFKSDYGQEKRRETHKIIFPD